jgi:hypothetical protein
MANTKISALTSATTPLAGTEVLPIVQSSATVKVAVSDLTAGRSISVAGLTNTALTASRPVFTDASKVLTSTGVVPVANGGTNVSAASITAFNNITGYTAAGATGTTSTNLVFSTSPSITTPTLVGDVSVSTGNIVIGTSGKGIDFSVTSQTGGMTSELFADYEEGTWTPIVTSGTGSITSYTSSGKYTKVGRIVTVEITYKITNNGTGASYGDIAGLPYTASVGCVGITRFNGTTGLSGQYSVAAGGTSGTVWNYDNTYPWATNAAGTITITYSV